MRAKPSARSIVTTLPELERAKGFIYFIDKHGDLSRTRRSTGHYREKFPHQKVTRLGIKRKAGYWYFINKLKQVVEFQPNPPKPKRSRKH